MLSVVTALESMNRPDTDQERNSAEDAEAAIDEAPRHGDASDRSGDEGKRDHAGARDQTKLDNPLVADGVNIGTDERDGDDNVRERQPVGAVRQERVARVCGAECGFDSFKPREQTDGLDEGQQ